MPAEVQSLCLAAIRKWVSAEDKVVRALFVSGYAAGDRRTFRTPDGTKLGEVRRDDPDPTWQITDPDALVTHLRAEYPGCTETTREIVGTEDQVVAVLAEHAPHLLAEVERVSPGAVSAAVEESRANGKAAAPGIELVAPVGHLVVTADKAAVARVAELVRGRVLPALTPAPEADAGTT